MRGVRVAGAMARDAIFPPLTHHPELSQMINLNVLGHIDVFLGFKIEHSLLFDDIVYDQQRLPPAEQPVLEDNPSRKKSATKKNVISRKLETRGTEWI